MSDENEPNLVVSSKSQRVVVDGYPFSIRIFRLETETDWTLDIEDFEGGSHVWDDTFASDKDARTAALEALEREGAFRFMNGDNVVPFPGQR